MGLHAQAKAMRDRVARNLNFGIARGLTQLAKAASEEVTRDLPQIFDRPTSFTQRGIGFAPATRSKLEARVFVRDIQARYLRRQEAGGVRTPEPGSPISLPVGIRTNQHGNIARGAIGRQRAKPNTFVSTGKGRTAHLPPGLYERAKRGKRRDGGRGTVGALRHKGRGRKVGGTAARGATGVKLLVAFKPRAQYEPRFGFHDRVEKFVRTNAATIIGNSIADAMRTMR